MLTNTNILLRQEKKLYKTRKEQTFLHKRGIKELVVLLCIIFDAATIFTAVDLYLTQKVWLSWTVTVALAFCLDVPPMLLGICVQDKKLSPRSRRLQIIGLLAAFLLTFLGTFALRFASMDQMFPVVTLGLDGVDGQEAAVAETAHTAGQYIMALILAILPLGTSICSFVLGLQSSVEDAVRHQLRLNQIELRQELDAMKVMRDELRQDMEFGLEDYDQQRYDIRLDSIQKQADILQSDARKILSEKIGTAEAVTELMEEPEAEQQDMTIAKHIPRLTA